MVFVKRSIELQVPNRMSQKHYMRPKNVNEKMFSYRPSSVKRWTFRVPNLMQMSSNKAFCSFALDSAHEKFDVWTRPYIFKWWCDELLSFELNKMAADKDGFSSYAAVLVTEDLAETETEERRWQVSISRIELRIGREFSYTFFMSFLYFLIYQFISHNSYIYFSIIGCIL